jgi:glyoxylase-like metal-dependent hydrolase (beta-lactamase superfamily II)
VLPTITPHIGGIAGGTDPLARFFASLERMQTLDGVKTVLPAHGHPFNDLGGRADAIREHHIERLARLREAMDELGPATVAELSHRLFAPRAWGPMAESETYAHLERLRLDGQAVRDESGGDLHYRAA